MLFSCEDIRSWRGAVGAGTLRLGLDAARHPCCVCCAEGADGTTGRSVAIRSLGLRSLAGDPAGGVKPRRLRWRGAGPGGGGGGPPPPPPPPPPPSAMLRDSPARIRRPGS